VRVPFLRYASVYDKDFFFVIGGYMGCLPILEIYTKLTPTVLMIAVGIAEIMPK